MNDAWALARDILVCGLIVATLHWAILVARVLRATRGQPGYVAVFAPLTMWGWLVLPAHFRFNYQRSIAWKTKRDIYQRYNSSKLVVPSLFPPSIHVFVSEGKANTIVSSDRLSFEKMGGGSPAVKVFGPNILNTRRQEYRRHRKVTAPAFSTANTEEVWRVSHSVLQEWFGRADNSTAAGAVWNVSDIASEMMEVTFQVFTRAGFGKQLPWASDSKGVGLREGIKASWIQRLPLPQQVQLAFQKIDVFKAGITKIISDLRADEVDPHRQDILNLLVGANTVSNALSSTLFLLADEVPIHQERIYEEAQNAFGGDSSPSIETRSMLKYTYATFQEGLRLFPPAQLITKAALRDTLLPATDNLGQHFNYHIEMSDGLREEWKPRDGETLRARRERILNLR
ncbi:hypothetical protein RQP46_011045 [Phenoliferia psychrophenolica]